MAGRHPNYPHGNRAAGARQPSPIHRTHRRRPNSIWPSNRDGETRPVEPAGDGSTLSVACHRTTKMARLEAVLLVADVPLSPRRLAQLATLADATEARTLIGRLNSAFEQTATPFRVERVAAGYR